jgi:hypothetical protein
MVWMCAKIIEILQTVLPPITFYSPCKYVVLRRVGGGVYYCLQLSTVLWFHYLLNFWN